MRKRMSVTTARALRSSDTLFAADDGCGDLFTAGRSVEFSR
ncbi:MAG: hypothetical protein ACI4NX_06940 [Megasphaera elsdenii]